MISVNEVEQIIASIKWESTSSLVTIEEAHGRILDESILADADLPPFNRAMMDGVAIQWTSDSLLEEFNIIGIQRAGTPQRFTPKINDCIEIMTGAEVPEPFNTIIPYEHIRIEGEIVHINIPPSSGQHIQRKGSDFTCGEQLIDRGKKLRSPEIGILASVGRSHVRVKMIPRVAVISTGDELVNINLTPGPGQIRRSNVYAVASVIRHLGMEVAMFHLNDHEEQIREGLAQVFQQYDMVILSGGVSMGKYDLIPQIMSEMHVKTLFHKIAQKPGKPFWCGVSEQGQPVFALPGNPVSTLMCMHRYVVPFLQKNIEGSVPVWHQVALDHDYVKKGTLTQFVPVNRNNETVTIVKTSGSGDFAHLQEANGWIEIPAELNEIKKGQTFRFIPFL